MTKLFFAVALLLLPSVSHANLVKPSSREGMKLVHQTSEQVSKVFVFQADELQGKVATEAPDCNAVRTTALASLSELDLSGASELASAYKALESASCESADLKKVSDKFFVATLSIRSFEDRN